MLSWLASSLSSASSSVRSFFSTYRRPLFFSASLLSSLGLIYAYRRLKPIYSSLRTEISNMNKLLENFQEGQKEQKRGGAVERFLLTGKVADSMLVAFLAKMRNGLKQEMDVETMRDNLKALAAQQAKEGKEKEGKEGGGGGGTGTTGGTPHRSSAELELWDQVKLFAFARTLAALIDSSLLSSLLKVQLSLLSRYALRDEWAIADSSSSSSSSSPYLTADGKLNLPPLPSVSNSPLLPFPSLPSDLRLQVERAYLRLSSHSQLAGFSSLLSSLLRICREELMRFPLSSSLKKSDFHSLLSSIRRRAEQETTFIPPSSPPSPSSSSSSSSSPHLTPFIPYFWPDDEAIRKELIATQFTINTRRPKIIQGGGGKGEREGEREEKGEEKGKNELKQNSIEYEEISSPCPPELLSVCSARLQEMCAETTLVFRSDSFSSALAQSLDQAFLLVENTVCSAVFPSSVSSSSSSSSAASAASSSSSSSSASSSSSSSSASSSSSSSSDPSVKFIPLMVEMIKAFHSLFPQQEEKIQESPLFRSLSSHYALHQASYFASHSTDPSSSFSSSSSSSSSSSLSSALAAASSPSPIAINLMYELSSIIFFPLSDYSLHRTLLQRKFEKKKQEEEENRQAAQRMALAQSRPKIEMVE